MGPGEFDLANTTDSKAVNGASRRRSIHYCNFATGYPKIRFVSAVN